MIKVTFGLLKPDCLIRGIEEKIFQFIINNGFIILMRKKVWLKPDDVIFLYQQHTNKPFFNELVKYMTSFYSIPFLATRRDSKDTIAEFNRLVGYWIPEEAERNTIRGLYGIKDYLPYDAIQNLIHSSSDVHSALREIRYFFQNILNKLKIINCINENKKVRWSFC